MGKQFGLLLSLLFIIKLSEIETPKFKEYKIKKDIIISIFKVAVPTILTEVIAPITTIILNNILKDFTENAVSFYSIYYKVQSVIFMVISGLNYGMIPIVSYNIGAKNKERVDKTIKLFIIWSLDITIIGTAIFMIFPMQILNIFNSNNEIMEIGCAGLRILSIGFVFAGVSFIITGIFNAIGNGNSNIIIFLARKVIIPFCFIIVMKNLIGISSIWYAFTIAEIVAFVTAVILLKLKYKKVEFNK